jgi:hypothetical protein
MAWAIASSSDSRGREPRRFSPACCERQPLAAATLTLTAQPLPTPHPYNDFSLASCLSQLLATTTLTLTVGAPFDGVVLPWAWTLSVLAWVVSGPSWLPVA